MTVASNPPAPQSCMSGPTGQFLTPVLLPNTPFLPTQLPEKCEDCPGVWLSLPASPAPQCCEVWSGSFLFLIYKTGTILELVYVKRVCAEKLLRLWVGRLAEAV